MNELRLTVTIQATNSTDDPPIFFAYDSLPDAYSFSYSVSSDKKVSLRVINRIALIVFIVLVSIIQTVFVDLYIDSTRLNALYDCYHWLICYYMRFMQQRLN